MKRLLAILLAALAMAVAAPVVAAPVDTGHLEADDGDVLTQWALEGRGIINKPLFDVKAHLSEGRLVEILPDSINWQAEEYAFNRLFVGPQAVPAPPYASVYLEAEPRLMGNAATDMREILQALGLAAPEGQPDDFIAC